MGQRIEIETKEIKINICDLCGYETQCTVGKCNICGIDACQACSKFMHDNWICKECSEETTFMTQLEANQKVWDGELDRHWENARQECDDIRAKYSTIRDSIIKQWKLRHKK